MRKPKWQGLSAYYWWRTVTGDARINYMLQSMISNEKPNSCAVVFERKCTGKCRHCIYASCQQSSQLISKKYDLEGVVCNIVRQLPESFETMSGNSPALIHVGREFNSVHISTLDECRRMRSDLLIGMINKGDFIQHLEAIRKANFRFDWVDVSIDGPEKIHNEQRDSSEAFTLAMEGIKKAPQIIAPNGTINALCTITKINFKYIEQTAKMLLEENLVSSLTFVFMSPDKRGTDYLEVSLKEFAITWLQLQKIFAQYNTAAKKKIFLQIFRHQDMNKIANIMGKQKFWEAFRTLPSKKNDDGINGFGVGKLHLSLDGITFAYFPTSICVTEGVLIDADGATRASLSQPYSLFELRNNPALKKFTYQQLDKKTDLQTLHEKSVKKWWQYFGSHYLQEEIKVFQ